jgi:RNA-splicing ligase RtcB
MNYSDLNKVTRKFLIGEGTKPGVHSYIQALGETLSKFKPKSMLESRRLEIANNQLKEIRRSVRKLEEQVSVLQEQLKVLEEGTDNK